jgi:hypothetical protein
MNVLLTEKIFLKVTWPFRGKLSSDRCFSRHRSLQVRAIMYNRVWVEELYWWTLPQMRTVKISVEFSTDIALTYKTQHRTCCFSFMLSTCHPDIFISMYNALQCKRRHTSGLKEMRVYNFKATPKAAFSRPICLTNNHFLNFNSFHVFNLNLQHRFLYDQSLHSRHDYQLKWPTLVWLQLYI